MAKKSSTESSGKGTSAFDLIKSFDNSAEILADSKMAVIKDYINTGNYMLNACMTGSLFKGVPTGRVLTLAGDPGTGKSFLAVSICREAQKKGYTPVYMDSEGAIDVDFVARLGCDTSNFVIKQVTTISEVSTFMANLLKQINEKPESERPKVIFVLDSLGNLTSDKELNDTIAANQKRDMTKQQEIKALFRTNMTALSRAQAPMIVCSHIYRTQDLFAKTIVSGGAGINYGASLTMLLTTAKLDDKESDKEAEKRGVDPTKTGVIVTATPQKSRFTIPQRVQFWIPFFRSPNPYVGLEKYLTWENSGIVRGEMISQKEYDKLPESEKVKCYEMADENGVLCYARQKETSRKIVVSHLHKEVPVADLFTPKVLTDELLHKLDDDVIRPNFELPASDTMADVEDLVDAGE